TDQFIAAFAQSMETILETQLREELGKNARELGNRYDMGPLVEIYSNLYAKILNKPVPAVMTMAA
ncbi:MAG: hypothetical protein KYX66_23110, partial [Blastomonas fulva]